MPTYSYRCRNCDHEHEDISTIEHRDDPRVCPLCGSRSNRLYENPQGYVLSWGGTKSRTPPNIKGKV